jgi:uncharacterized protein YpmS
VRLLESEEGELNMNKSTSIFLATLILMFLVFSVIEQHSKEESDYKRVESSVEHEIAARNVNDISDLHNIVKVRCEAIMKDDYSCIGRYEAEHTWRKLNWSETK